MCLAVDSGPVRSVADVKPGAPNIIRILLNRDKLIFLSSTMCWPWSYRTAMISVRTHRAFVTVPFVMIPIIMAPSGWFSF